MVADQRKGAEALLAAAGEVCARKKISEARARQVRWVAREYGRALEHPGHPLGVDAEVGELFQRRAVEAYLDLAGRGELRVRQSVKKVSGDRSRKARLEVLNLLAEALGVCADLPPQPDPAPKRTVSRRARSLLRTSLQEAADRTSLPGHIRMLAIGAVGTDTGARSGEHCACRIDDLAPSLEEIRIVRRPQGWKETESYVELIALSEVSRAALRRWLEEREVLLERVQGAATALWVSLRPNHRGERVIPPGTPLEPRGLYRAWTRAVTEINQMMAGEPSWAPLPSRMEQVRRGVSPKASPAPRQPDAERAAVLLDDVARCGRALAAVRRSGRAGTGEELRARRACRTALREAWAEGVEHALQVAALAEAGVAGTEELTAAGWDPYLLKAVDRAAGWGRPSKAKDVV